MTQSKTLQVFVLVTLFFIVAPPVFAQIVISEIMYAPNEGVAHEWFERFNSGAGEVDIEDWRFSDGSNHVFSKPPKNGGQGSLVIQPGEYAIVAKEADTFLSAHSGFGGTVIDGSFSLTDSGDTLSLIDGNSIVVDSVSYDENAGAKKNELSLQLMNGAWAPSAPTPGSGEVSQSQQSQQSQTQSQTEEGSQTGASTSSSGGSFLAEPQIFTSAGTDRTVTVGADSLFKGEAVGIVGKALTGARFVWNFGDGTRTEGPQVLHYYRYPGEYVVTLEVSSGEYSASDRAYVSVREAKVIISRSTPEVITIANIDEYELNLSWWSVVVGGISFMLPEHTVILSEHEIHLSSDITGLHPNSNGEVTLQYPNGETVVLYVPGYTTPLFKNTPIQSTYGEQSIVGTKVLVVNDREEAVHIVVEEESGNSPYTASVAESIQSKEIAKEGAKEGAKDRESSPMFWFALVGMVVLGSISAVALRRKSRGEITIID